MGFASLAVLALANAGDAVEVVVLGLVLTHIPLVQSTPGAAAAASTAIFAGLLVGSLVGGPLADSLGRRAALLRTLPLAAVFGGLSGLVVLLSSSSSPSPSSAGGGDLSDAEKTALVALFATLRCCAGVCVGAAMPGLFALAGELGSAMGAAEEEKHQQKGRCRKVLPAGSGLGVAVAASGWMLGGLFAAGSGLLLLRLGGEGGSEVDPPPWFAGTFLMVSALPAAIATVLVWQLVPESPMFLAQQAQELRSQEQDNSREFSGRALNDPLSVQHTDAFSPLLQPATSRRRRVLESVKTDFLSLFAPQVRRALVLLAIAWFALSWAYYGVLAWLSVLLADLHDDTPFLTSLLMSAAAFPGNLLSYVLLDRLPRVLLVCSLVAAGASLVLFGVTGVLSPQVGSFCYAGTAVIAWNSLDFLSVNCFPEPIRGKAFGALSVLGRCASIGVQPFNAIASPFVVFGAAAVGLVAAGVAVAGLPKPAP
jgi:MFS family permease